MEHLTVTPMISIRPNRLSVTKLVRRINLGNFFVPASAGEASFPNGGKTANLKKSDKKVLHKKFHEFKISENSQRNLRDKISYLFQFAKSRRIKTYSGKVLPNFKVCFLTLTLPSQQVHTTAEIYKSCLEPFLEVLRKRLKLQNYVWRLEHQANGNVHYHIATDTYIDYFFAQKHWNAIIEKLGYVSRFASKMASLPYTEYQKRYSQNGTISPDILYKRWARGKAEKWQNPNTVDVKNAKSSDNIGYYISKYFSKKEKTSNCNHLDNEENSFALRLCFWSRSLSKCKAESMPFDYYPYDLVSIFSRCQEVLRCVFDYCTVFYFQFNKLPASIKSIIGEYFNQFRQSIAYQPAC